MLPLVSIVIPNYNNAVYLKDSLESVLAQDYPNKQVIVVDDGSTDDSLSVLENYGKHIQTIKNSHAGASAARNAGILAAEGELIALMDSDDIWMPNKLTLQVSHLQEGLFDLVYCGGLEFGRKEGDHTVYIPKFSGNCSVHFHDNPTSAVIILGCSSAIFKKSLLPLTGIFDTTFQNASEDWDFFRRYCDYANVGFIAESLVHYRRHDNNMSSSSIHDYYDGNCKAVRKMLLLGSDSNYLRNRKTWNKLQWSYIKTFMKTGDLFNSLKCTIRIFLPISL